jgi:hypothetical protein
MAPYRPAPPGVAFESRTVGVEALTAAGISLSARTGTSQFLVRLPHLTNCDRPATPGKKAQATPCRTIDKKIDTGLTSARVHKQETA